ncbi:MAG: NAD-dependent epimerase/dehydratase family protein [Bacteroidota bacterium]
MKVFVSGATGYIGIQLVKRLAESGVVVHALYRSASKAGLISFEGVKLFKGDIMEKEGLARAMEGCSQAYHVAAFADVWSKDPGMFRRYNVEGTLNVIDVARAAGVKRMVLTSTAGILGHSDKEPVHENSPVPSSFFTLYEASKYEMELELKNLSISNPEIVIVNPTRVFGPGYLSKSNGMSLMIKKYISGKWRFIPGNGERRGNYVYVEDVVSGHLLAMEKGKHGERYVLGGEDISYNQLFTFIREASGIRIRLYKIPLQFLFLAAAVMLVFSKISGKAPLIVPSWVRKLTHNWIVSSEKAISQLGYRPISAKEGIEKTVQWLTANL